MTQAETEMAAAAMVAAAALRVFLEKVDAVNAERGDEQFSPEHISMTLNTASDER